MTSNRTTRSAVLVTLALASPALLASPVSSKEKRVPLEEFRARVFDVNRSKVSLMDIVIYEWTSPEERQSLLDTFVDEGSEALYDALGDAGNKGYVRLPHTLAYDMQYAWQAEVDGKRRILLATDRPVTFLELVRGFRSRDYNVSLVILELDPETGKGEGTALGGAELKMNEETGRIEIEFLGTQPTRLTNVTPKSPRKRKRGG